MPGAVDFKERISRQRPHDRETYGHAGNTDLQDIVYQLESDRGRIVNSAAVRRLQQKTQVFPLERNAAVRSRLTHSLEVQQTGRFIVRTLSANWARVPRRSVWTGWKARWKAWWKWPA